MSPEATRQVSALIGRVQTQFHEGHRRALPELLAMAAAVEARGVDDGLSDELREIGNALEQHMFKEEIHSDFSVFRVPQLDRPGIHPDQPTVGYSAIRRMTGCGRERNFASRC